MEFAEENQSCYFEWSEYQSNMSSVVQQLLEEDCMVDVTISVADQRIHAHRIVLSACSILFQEILSQTKEDHPTIIISDVSPEDVKSIIEFCYHGEVKIPVDNISSLLEASHLLKICGLMEIEGLDEDSKDGIREEIAMEYQENLKNNNLLELPEDNQLDKSKKRQREIVKKGYSKEMLESAINDIRSGHSLIESATKNNVPKSTLYMHAKSLGIQLNPTRNDYSPERIRAAIEAIINGSSFQHASETFNIPKTVLWRRKQKEGYQIVRSDMRRNYDPAKREAAIQALERGENLTKVATEFQIPKTTLFRDKIKLVENGKLPKTFWKKRKSEDEKLKLLRLEKAVKACKEGRLSQAAASVQYSIPKTTIWRKLHKDNKKQTVDNICVNNESISDFDLSEVPSEIPITYIDENNLPQESIIILTSDHISMEDHEYQQSTFNCI